LVDGTKNEITHGRQYIALLLPANGLRGVLPPELAMLSDLLSIDLSGNLLTGPITTTLGDLDKSEVLDLGQNFGAEGAWLALKQPLKPVALA
jgi:hypothetical protein